jgi:prepilin-type N-terminal cleavage/methylation domain-containing protein
MIRGTLARLRREDGFSLTELLVVMPVLAILLAVITGLLVTMLRGNTQTTGQLTQQSTYFPTIDAMMQDVRNALPPTLGGSPLISGSSTQLVFYSPDEAYATSGTTSPFHLREIAYQFSGGALQKQIVTSTNTYSTVTSTTPWGSWTSSAGTFPLSSFPTAAGWTTILGSGLAGDGSSPAITSASFAYYAAGGITPLSTPLSASDLLTVRTVVVSLTSSVPGSPSSTTTYTDTATIRETQPTS